MAVIRARKTRLIKAGMVGAVISLIPSLVACGVLVYFNTKKNAKIEDTQTELAKYTQGAVCVLASDVYCGQVLTAEDITIVKGRFEENCTALDKEFFVGQTMIIDADAGTILNECVVANSIGYDADARAYYVDYIEAPSGMSPHTNFDIRISFPNGEDYLVAANKCINDRDEEGFYLDLTRKEAFMMSSAKVDCSIYEGTKLYLAFYSSGYEKEEIQTYPVNSYVFSLSQWEPNIEEAFHEEDFLRREILESNLFEFMGVTNKLQ